MARKKVTSVPALADWGAVDNALRDIRECQHTLAEMAVQRDRQIDSIKADYAQGALPLQNRVKALESEVKAYESLLEELAAANKKQEELRQTVERQQCYISGLEYALRHMTPTVVVESHEKGAKEKAG